MSREILNIFRASPWQGPEEVSAFMSAIGPPTPQLLQGMLSVLIDRRAALEGKKHGLRCAIFQRLASGSLDRSLFVPYCRALVQGDLRVRTMMVELIPNVHNPHAYSELVNAFRSDERAIREAGLQVTLKIGTSGFLAELTTLCGRSDFFGRFEALHYARDIVGAAAWPLYQNILRAGSDAERVATLKAIGGINWSEHDRANLATVLERFILDRAESVGVAAVEIYSKMVPEGTFIDTLDKAIGNSRGPILRAAIKAVHIWRTETALRWLQEQFRIGPNSIRLAVIETLELYGTSDVMIVLSEALDHRTIDVRMRAAEVLQRLSKAGKIDVARSVIWLLRSKDMSIRRMAAEIANSIQDVDGSFWPTLLSFLRDEDWWVRERITDALVGMAGTQLTRYAVGLLADEAAVVRRYAVDLLVRLKDPQSLGALVRQAQQDEDWWVRERAIEAMGELKDQRAIPYISHIMEVDPEVIMVALAALTEISGDGAFDAVAPYLRHENPEVVYAALECLEDSKRPELIQHISPLIQHYDPRIAKYVGEILIQHQVLSEAEMIASAIEGSGSPLDRILVASLESDADDVMLTPNRPIWIKRFGEMIPLGEQVLSSEQLVALLLPTMTPIQREAIERRMDLDYSYTVSGGGPRFRVNAFHMQNGLAAVFRRVSSEVPKLGDLNLPEIVGDFANYRYGLVLVGGPTGSGKSTTLAALINDINKNHPRHIITIEDPIEVLHMPELALVNQREVGTHTLSFDKALRSTLREDPDVILVGEMRDEETISFAISAAETGHLVFGTVHTVSAEATVDRLINSFPASSQPQVRSILANCLKAVLCQFLVPRADGEGRVASVEVMVNNSSIANLIRKGKTFQIPSVIATSKDAGMQSMDGELLRLFREGTITADDAYLRAANKKDFETFLAELDEMAAHQERLDKA